MILIKKVSETLWRGPRPETQGDFDELKKVGINSSPISEEDFAVLDTLDKVGRRIWFRRLTKGLSTEEQHYWNLKKISYLSNKNKEST